MVMAVAERLKICCMFIYCIGIDFCTSAHSAVLIIPDYLFINPYPANVDNMASSYQC